MSQIALRAEYGMTLLRGVAIPVALMTIVVLMVLPVPALMLDVLFTFNITLALIVLLVTVYTPRPLDFAIFPSLLLIATLLRLSLNVASTRIVLLKGHSGPDAAGEVINAFGNFVARGNYTVGFVVFVILVVINFVVVTKGAGRVSEVSARFTLDAMPGKQMAIDADLNAGILDQDQARDRRREISEEADFYGAMDGASKFVRGDAVAGLIILAINMVGGLVIGTQNHEMSFIDAMQRYGLLTIGDGLAAQLPSLLLSTATAILVTRVSRSSSMEEQFSSQLFGNPVTLGLAALIIGSLGVIPGMPQGVFLTLALALGGVAWISRQRQKARLAETASSGPEEPKPAPVELGWEDIERPDTLAIEVGYKLISLLKNDRGGPLLARIKGIRKKLSRELGFLVQPVRIHDNLELAPNAYRIKVHGVPIAQAEVLPERHLAIDPGEIVSPIEGIAAKDPAFGLDGLWIDGSQVAEAQSLGYTVVDSATVIATHLSRIIFDHSAELLGFEEAQKLLDRLAETSPKLVEDLVPKSLPMFALVKVLKNLLRERVSIRDVRTIAESLTERAASSQDPDILTEGVRETLARAIVQKINGLEQELALITLDPQLERILLDSKGSPGNGPGTVEPELVDRLQNMVRNAAENQEMRGSPAVLAVSPALRHWLSRLLRPLIPSLHVLAFTEIPDDKRVRIALNVGPETLLSQGSKA